MVLLPLSVVSCMPCLGQEKLLFFPRCSGERPCAFSPWMCGRAGPVPLLRLCLFNSRGSKQGQACNKHGQVDTQRSRADAFIITLGLVTEHKIWRTTQLSDNCSLVLISSVTSKVFPFRNEQNRTAMRTSGSCGLTSPPGLFGVALQKVRA